MDPLFSDYSTTVRMRIVDNRDLGTTIVMPTVLRVELTVPEPAEGSFETQQTQLRAVYPDATIALCDDDEESEMEGEACALL